ncbi:alpha/beta hydrolase fold protein [Hyaloraphidium curvatum]|nr:alpha/beta hydrolase fold protein [Hyaloraphidium curvatum]
MRSAMAAERTVKANGIDIVYEEHGPGDGPPVLLIMGFTAQMLLWPDSLLHALAVAGFRVVRFDNRDAGRSTKLASAGPGDVAGVMAARAKGDKFSGAAYTLDDMAKDAAELLAALNIDKAHIVGASMGGMIAQTFALNHPERAKSLVSIMSNTGKPGLSQAKPEAMAMLMTPIKADTEAERIEAFKRAQRIVGSPAYPASDAELESLALRMARRAPVDLAANSRQMVAIMASEPRHERLRTGVRCPALVIHGSADPLVPLDHGEDTHKSIPGSELLVLEGVGHDISDANVKLYLDALLPFLTKAEGRNVGSGGTRL